MSSDGDDDPQSPSAFLEAPSSQSVIVDAKSSAPQPNLETIHSDDFDQDSSEDERENRFPGNPSTWRDFTADERTLAASLDQERANDLRVHLYNAHALKSRLYDRTIASESNPWQSKQYWTKTDDAGNIPWRPDPAWTAWPLHADDVPRKSEGFGKDALLDDAAGGVLRMTAPWKPAADLEDEVQALMLRRAKERFQARPWETATAELPQRSLRSRSMRSRSVSELPSSPPTAATSRQSSVANEPRSRASGSDNDMSAAMGFRRPELMIDEDDARRLLRSSTQHVLSDFNKVLMGLHKSRQYQIPSSRPSVAANTKPQAQKRKRHSTAGEAHSALTKAKLENATSKITRVKATKDDDAERSSGSHALGPRDWSEVLGIASMSGWDPAVVDRAAKRCAALFGEHMALKVMPETAAGNAADKVTGYIPDMVPDLEISDEEDVTQEMTSRSSSETGYSCPEESCPQHHRLYEKRFMIRQHLRRVHKYGKAALDAYDQAHTATETPAANTIAEKEDGHGAQQVETQALGDAVDTDGYMLPLDFFLGRGKDVQDRKQAVSGGRRGRNPRQQGT